MSEHHASEDQISFLDPQEVIVEDFDASGHILDIGGGGEGVIGVLKGEQVIAIDARRSELEQAAPGPLKIVMDARELMFLDSTFNTVTAFFTLMYIQDTADCEQVLREVFRVLKPDGRFLVWEAVIPQRPDTDKDIVAFHITIKLPDQEISTGYGTRWPEEEKNLAYYVRLAQDVGFSVIVQNRQERLFFLELRKPSILPGARF